MDAKRSMLQGSVLAVVLMALAAGLSVRLATGQQPAPPPALAAAETRAIQTAVNEAKPLASWAVVQELNGSIQKVDSYLAAFMKEFSAQDLDESLLSFDSTAVLILYEDPGAKPQVRMAIGLMVPARLRVKAPLKVQRLQASRAVRHVHVGPYEQLGRVHSAVGSSLQQASRSAGGGGGPRPGWPVTLRLLNDPRLVKREAIRTEMIVPVDAPPRADLGAESLAGIEKAARAPKPVSFWMVSQTFEGSVTQTGDLLRRFMEQFTAQGLGRSLPSPDTAPLAVLHGNPDQQKTIRIEIGFPVRERIQVKAPLKIRQFQLQRAVTYTHQGGYAQLSNVHGQIAQAVRKVQPAGARGAGLAFPVTLRLLTDPNEVPPDRNRTEMIVPLGAGNR